MADETHEEPRTVEEELAFYKELYKSSQAAREHMRRGFRITNLVYSATWVLIFVSMGVHVTLTFVRLLACRQCH